MTSITCFDWVTAAWRAAVAPNVFLFISLLVVFEAVVGVLILSGGRRTQVGLVGAIAFHLAMWLFGWGVTIYALIMVPALALLLRAERRPPPSLPPPSPRQRLPISKWRAEMPSERMVA